MTSGRELIKATYGELTNGRAFSAYGFNWFKTSEGAERMDTKVTIRVPDELVVDRLPWFDNQELIRETRGY